MSIFYGRNTLVRVTALHSVLCAALLLMHWRWFSVGESLFYWWVAPFDALCLLAGLLFFWRRTVGPGFLLSVSCSFLEGVALCFLGLKNPETAPAHPFLLAVFVWARSPLARWALLAHARFSSSVEGCSP